MVLGQSCQSGLILSTSSYNDMVIIMVRRVSPSIDGNIRSHCSFFPPLFPFERSISFIDLI
jgi:hypothetical protein